ncbi:MAG: HEAT repeat domain-containing protein, partial [Planctomycetales bacterium]|nr:HEAT repeat domain-containing protein [Planctomycetales bacterium]
MRPALAAACLVLGAWGPVAALADETAGTRAAERRVLEAASAWRTAQGVPALVPSETVAIVLREHLDRLVRLGWRGGPLPPEAGRVTERARRLHGLRGVLGEVFDNYATTVPPDVPDAAAVVADLAKTPAGNSLGRADLRLAAAAAAPVEPGRWIVALALAEGAPEPVERARETLAPLAEKVRGPDPAARRTAVEAAATIRSLEALPLLREAASLPEPETRALALRGLGALRSRAAIPDLIAALRDGAEPARAAAAEALAALTGRNDLGADPARWAAWWEAARETFASPPRETAPGAASAGEAATPAEAPPLAELLATWNRAAESRDLLRKVSTLQALRE